MKTKFFLFFLLLCLVASSCESEHFNDWETMEWKTIPEMQFLEEFPYYVVQIPAEGAEYTLICTNYAQLMNINILDKDNLVHEELTNSHPHFENEWLSITKENGNSIKIAAIPNLTTKSRELILETSHGNVGTHFLLRQAPSEQ
ncbi:MAG: hypothetical protein J6M53_04075 [Bacteroidaceae bacterium]|nr:hypothetical protein [Bacteroidaceae bacterium]